MSTPPLILGLDTSGPYCAAAIARGDTIMASAAEEMPRGQAERLMTLLEELLSAQGVGWADLDALAVGTGPGNFTGIRIGVSATRGLALGLGLPAYGVDGFAARGRIAPTGSAVAIPAPRDAVYITDADGPRLVARADVPSPAPEPTPSALAEAITRHAAAVWPAPTNAPAPIYVRAPDAAPARDGAPVLLP